MASGAKIGQHTLVIFPFHLLLFPIFTGVLVNLFKVPKAAIAHSNLVGIGDAIAAIVVLLPVAWGLNRYAPDLVGPITIDAPN
jgi:fucose 4-O-acetylase-like acetyltransferase